MVVNGHPRRRSRRRLNGRSVLPSGLRAYWRLDEPAGEVRRDGAGYLPLTDTGSGVAIARDTGRLTSAAKWISGTGNAGAGRSLLGTEAVEFQILGGESNVIFIELWAYFDALNQGGTLFSFNIDSEDIFQIGVFDDAGTKKIDVNGQMDTSAYGHATQPTVTTAGWYYIEGYYDPATDTVGVAVSSAGGALQAVSTLEGAVGGVDTWNGGVANVTIGDVHDTTAGDTIRISNVGIWNVIRSTADRTKSFNGYDPTA